MKSRRHENRDRPMVPSPKFLRIVHRNILGAGFNRQKIWPALIPTYRYLNVDNYVLLFLRKQMPSRAVTHTTITTDQQPNATTKHKETLIRCDNTVKIPQIVTSKARLLEVGSP